MTDYKELENESFVNPYHFVSLGDKCDKKIRYRDARKVNLTGWLVCNLKTLTPLFIPNTTREFHRTVIGAEDEQLELRGLDFFTYTDLNTESDELAKITPDSPVIPGSEIRGVIRSAFETITDSCLSTIDNERTLFKRVLTPADSMRLAYQDEKWLLYPCKKYRFPKKWVSIKKNKIYIHDEVYEEGQVVYIKTASGNKATEIRKSAGDGRKKGYLHIGEYQDDKRRESVFIPVEGRAEDIDLQQLPRILGNLVENILLYRTKNNQTEQHNRYLHFDKGTLTSLNNLVAKFENNEITINQFNSQLKNIHSIFQYLNGALVYRKTHGGLDYLSPAAIGREVFFKRLDDLIGSYKPCSNIDDLCPACALFGFAHKGQAAASRLRFVDALLLDKQADYEKPCVLDELASPKISATEFYLEKTVARADLWNYDYAGHWGRKYGKASKPWTDLEYQPRIRGRKFYWHHKEPNKYSIPVNKATERSLEVRPLKKDHTFAFRIYFSNISPEDLAKLIWTLEIGGSDDHAHKIGMGKPLGLGSIQVRVQEIVRRVIEPKDGTIVYEQQDMPRADLPDVNDKLGNTKSVEEFRHITNFAQAPPDISYPYNVNGEHTYEWFMANKMIDGKGTFPVIHQALPNIKRPYLNSYEEIDKPTDSQKNRD